MKFLQNGSVAQKVSECFEPRQSRLGGSPTTARPPQPVEHQQASLFVFTLRIRLDTDFCQNDTPPTMRLILARASRNLLPSALFQNHSRNMSNFRIIEHVVRAQHSRERWAAAELGYENQLRLHVKQYIPLSNPHPQAGDVTIIGAVANSFPKETAEPYWDDLHEALKSRGCRIRSIWIADPVNQGHSGVLNEHILGPDRNCHLSLSI